MRKLASTLSLLVVGAVAVACSGSPASGGSTSVGGGGTAGVGGASSIGGSGAATGGKSSIGGTSAGAATGGKSGSSATGGKSGTGGASVTSTGGANVATGGATGTTGAPPAGNPDGNCAVPAAAQAAVTTNPTHVIGNGTPASCTSAAVISTIALGGVITFNCGSNPLTITLTDTAKIYNNTGPEIVIDGGGLVTLSGGGQHRILYMDTCDESLVWTSSACQNQDSPHLTLQNLTFINGNSTGQLQEGGGGGAVLVRGGRVKVVNCRFFNNVCDSTGQDLGGAGLRVLSQYNGLPVYVVHSTFGGASGYGNQCSNGGGISSIGVSWTVINSLFSYNSAIGNGGNPADPGTPGGGSGGAIYNDGNTMTLTLCGTRIEQNQVKAYGSAIFFVSNDHTGNIVIDQSVITNNIGGSWYPTYPQISNHDDTPITVTNSTIQ